MLVVDDASPQPPYEQLKTQFIDQILSGELASGAQLPTVRRLAADLGLAPNTVARTYRELEAAGFVLTQGRRGTRVAARSTVGGEVRREAERFAQEMRRRGMSTSDVLWLVRSALDAG